MNENDKGGGGRRRSSRRRGGRSGAKQQDRGEGLQKQTIASSRMGEERPSSPERASRTRSERARRGDRRSGQGDQQTRKGTGERAGSERQSAGLFDKVKNRSQYPDRPRWTPPRLTPPVLPKPECPRCGRPIEDLAAAINDRETGEPTHFDCVIERIAEGESLGEGDKVIYIGGGRFGVVHFENPNDLKRFQIRKTVQWEEKEKRSPWRRDVADQYSAT